MSNFEKRIEELDNEIKSMNTVPRQAPVQKKVRSYKNYIILASPFIIWFLLYMMLTPNFVKREDEDGVKVVDGGSVLVYMIIGTILVACGMYTYDYFTKGKYVNSFAHI